LIWWIDLIWRIGFILVSVIFIRLHVYQTTPFEQMGSDRKSTSLMRDSIAHVLVIDQNMHLASSL